MKIHSLLASGFVTVSLMSSALAGEAPSADKAPKRELLQPPKTSIASPITDRLALRGIYYQPAVTTQLRYDSSTGVTGSLLSAENDLLFDNKMNQGNLEFMFRMLDRHRIRADFFTSSRSSAQLLTRTILFGDDVYQVSDRLNSKLDLKMLNVTYNYSFIKLDRVELSIGLGLHLLQAEGKLEVPTRFLRESFDVAGPLATLSADATWRMTRRFSANLRAQYMGGNVDDTDASFSIYHGDVQFRVRPNMALGLGYSQTTIDLTSTSPDFTGLVLLEFKGPEAFVRVSL
jgi:hypothetical protein